MSTAHVQVAFEGDAVKGGTIDAREFATSLLATSDLYQRANQLVNGEGSEATVHVSADFERSSFDVNLVLQQGIVEQMQGFITGHHFWTAMELAVALGLIKNRGKLGESLISILKWLGGKKPDKIEKIGDKIHLELAGQKKTVYHTTYNFIGDNACRSALAQMLAPIARPGIDRMVFKSEDGESELIEKNDLPSLRQPEVALETEDEGPHQGERDTVLTIVRLSFQSRHWTFVEGGAPMYAEILDEAFWKRLRSRQERFADGDRLRATVNWRVTRVDSKLVTENKVVKVHRHLSRERKQLNIEGEEETP